MLNKKGFTLVEIMIVVAIIALLAAIAIPNLLRSKIAGNKAKAVSAIRMFSTASEAFSAVDNNGKYPLNMSSLTGSTPPYINVDYCGQTISGFVYVCTQKLSSYLFIAYPVSMGVSGITTYTMRTGGVLTP
ncbi:hypothetical protein MNBD_BACTEROID05-233 [hydrothermal vent metagenome]|uniref:Type II secretion envelope pseudopilin protein (PulG,guides folded protein to PulD in outer membrane) n=1 Tax=hydrothermal vent metagenome TaxID=652676 RepID=A0A3B0TPP5_9ZZZZ